MPEASFDVVILGGGPGGYVAAIRAAQLGFSTAVVERENLGGICLNWGCIPTKALLRTAEIAHLLRDQAKDFGFQVGEWSFDLAKVVARSRRVADRLSKGVTSLMKKNDVRVLSGTGALAAPGLVSVRGPDGAVTEVAARHVILATGARAKVLPGLEPHGELIWTYREAMLPKALPASLLVVGSGAIGIEFASFYHQLGVEVTVVEVLPRILPAEDEEISKLARKIFAKQGIRIHTGAKLGRIEKGADDVSAQVELDDGKSVELRAARVVSAVGITGNVEGIGLDGTAIVVERGHVLVNEWLQTGEPGVYAIGDLVGPPWLAHKAMHEGVICVERIAGEDVQPLDPTMIPGCTYSLPQIASVGLTEEKARAGGREVRVGRFPWLGNGKAIALGETEGLVKTIFDAATGELLGAHLLGPEVTELIQGYAIARGLETTQHELMRTVFPHPTLSEAMHESVLAAFGRALHS
ncbi:dihydrolipoyl dehydrogenase [Parvibaculum sp.]|uniref:dihydrolipoyl dehydrogenase n=1 Tax=Parvibaculum sp. TaxID=2024848 RepID=UPI003BAAEAAB